MTEDTNMGLGERKSRSRRNRYFAYMGVAVVLGLVIGTLMNLGDSSGARIFAGDGFAGLDPFVSLTLAFFLLLGLGALPLWGFTQIDELQREQNYIGFTGGMIAVLAGFPVWAVLAAGGFVPAPSALDIFLLGFGAMAVTFGIVKLRDRFS